ncbi:MAG: helix-hairpin-helix domain-containing protein [Candidatus Dadabacteria bacterium]|nr:helix-hairpin-helix domain-containing protein [Candidatus Dadabacteria bacterium]
MFYTIFLLVSTQSRYLSLKSFFLLSIFIAAIFSAVFAASLFARTSSQNQIELLTAINPNTAPAASLIRLPGIGITRASAIIEYRKNFPGNEAYLVADDLQKIHGIGPKTAQKISKYLNFSNELTLETNKHE